MFDESPSKANEYEYLTPKYVAAGYLNASEAMNRPPVSSTPGKGIPSDSNKVYETARTASTPPMDSTYSTTSAQYVNAASVRPPVAKKKSVVSTHENKGETKQTPEQELKNLLTSNRLKPTGSPAKAGDDQENPPKMATLKKAPPPTQPKGLGGGQDMASKPREQTNPQNQSNLQVNTGNTNGQVNTEPRGRQYSDTSENPRPERPAVPVKTPPGHPVGTVAPVQRVSAIQPDGIKSPDSCMVPAYQHAQKETAKTWKALRMENNK